jgi:hypothetical protein
MKKPVRAPRTSVTQRVNSGGRISHKKQCRSSSIRLEAVLANLGSMNEANWGKSTGQEVW